MGSQREREKEEFERIQKLVGPEREAIRVQREEARKRRMKLDFNGSVTFSRV